MPFHVEITKNSFIVCIIFIAIAFVGYGFHRLKCLIANQKVNERWHTVLLLSGILGFALGSLGFAPIIYAVIDVIKYILGVMSSILPQFKF